LLNKKILLSFTIILLLITFTGCGSSSTIDKSKNIIATISPNSQNNVNSQNNANSQNNVNSQNNANGQNNVNSQNTTTDSILQNDIYIVKNSIYSNYNNRTMGQAIQSMMDSPDWEAFIGDDGNQYVQVGGYIYYNNKPTVAVLQYVMLQQNTYMIYAFYIDEVIQNQSMINQFLQTAYSN